MSETTQPMEWLSAAAVATQSMTGSTERHYTVQEVASMWGLSNDLTRDIFRDEPGVLRIDRPETRKKRGYLSLRIPQSVVDRVHIRLTNR